jgi:hypothetical protein
MHPHCKKNAAAIMIAFPICHHPQHKYTQPGVPLLYWYVSSCAHAPRSLMSAM